MKRLVALSAVLVLLLVGCGDDEGTDLDQLTSTTREESTTTSEDDSDEPDDETTTTESSDDDDDEEPSSGEPDSYGDDEELDALWDDCDDGDDDACNELFWTSPSGSEYETFGSTCGGRGDEGDCT